MRRTIIIVLLRSPVVTYIRWTTVIARPSATVWRKAPVVVIGPSIVVEASTVRAPAPLSHPLAVLIMRLVHSVGIPFVIIRQQIAERLPISLRRVDRSTGRRVVVRAGITPIRRLWLHSLRIGRSISAQGISRRPWRTGPQADSKTTTVGIYDLFSRSIPELRDIRMIVGILL
jgi:hypothetical protein